VITDGRRVDLDELRAFLSIVEHGSALEAARVENVSRTTLRRRAEALEARAGVSLFENTAQGAHLTEAGRLLAEQGRRLAAEAAAMLTAVRELGREAVGTLRVVVPAGLPPQALVAFLTLVRTRHPKLVVEGSVSDDPLASKLDAVDLALHIGTRPTRGPWITAKLVDLTLWLVASKSYLERRGRPTTLADLAGHTLLMWRPPPSTATRLEVPIALPLRAGGTFRVDPTIIMSDVHALRQAAIAGLGIALLPDAKLPDPGFKEPPLEPVLPDVVGQEIALWAAIPEVLRNAPKIRAILAGVGLVIDEIT